MKRCGVCSSWDVQVVGPVLHGELGKQSPCSRHSALGGEAWCPRSPWLSFTVTAEAATVSSDGGTGPSAAPGGTRSPPVGPDST